MLVLASNLSMDTKRACSVSALAPSKEVVRSLWHPADISAGSILLARGGGKAQTDDFFDGGSMQHTNRLLANLMTCQRCICDIMISAFAYSVIHLMLSWVQHGTDYQIEEANECIS